MIKLIMVFLLSLYILPSEGINRDAVSQHTYKLSLDKKITCLIPIVDLKEGAVTAGHCITDLKNKGYTEFWGVNEKGTIKLFKLRKHKDADRGLDYAVFTDNETGGVEIAKRNDVQKEDLVYMYSNKSGWETRQVRSVPNNKYESTRAFIKGSPSDSGKSGSGVYTINGKLWGIFVAITGDPNDPRGVVMPIENILEDV